MECGENALAGIIFGCTSKLNVNLTIPMKSWVGGIAGLNIGTISKLMSSTGTIRVTPDKRKRISSLCWRNWEKSKFESIDEFMLKKNAFCAGKITVTGKQLCGLDVRNCC